MPDEKNPPSWWITLPGVIASVAGLLTAVGGLLLVLHTLGVFDKPKARVDQTAVKEAEPRKIPDEVGPKKTTPTKKVNLPDKDGGVGPEPAKPTKKVVPKNHRAKGAEPAPEPAKPASYFVPGTNRNFVEKDGHIVSTENGGPLCPTPPGWRMGCYALELQYQQNWRNTPDGYIANGKKVKTFTNRSERVFEILGTKHAFYVDDGHLYDYSTATILCPWPKAGVAQCQAIEPQYETKWRNTPNGFIADGREFNGDEVMRQVRQGLF
jgi:hypothetical protein